MIIASTRIRHESTAASIVFLLVFEQIVWAAMVQLRKAFRSRALIGLAAVLALQFMVIIVQFVGTSPDQPHGASVAISAPAFVANTLATEVNALPEHPFQATASTNDSSVRQAVAQGRTISALLVDLASTTDTFVVSSSNGTRLNAALVHTMSALASGRGRGLTVEDVAPQGGANGQSNHARTLALTWIIAGLGAAAAIAFRYGPAARTRTKSLLRLGGLAGFAMTISVLTLIAAHGSIAGSLSTVWLLGSLTVFTAAATTLALQALAGLTGIGIATVLFVSLAAPAFASVHPLLLPQPWATIDPWAPHGAAISAMSTVGVFGRGLPLHPVLVLLAWSLLAVATVGLSRREQRRVPPIGRLELRHDQS